jgi:hypothetical protein
MAGETKQGTLHDAETSTGREIVKLPKLPSMTLFFITISGGAATVAIEISDDEVLFIPVVVVAETSVVQFAIPASVVSCNITSNAGTVTVKYRSVVLENIPAETLLVYNSAGEVSSPIITPEQTILEASQITRKKLAQLEIAAAAATVYTVPAGKQTVIENLILVSTSVGAQIVTLWHDGSADSNMILPPTTIVAGGFAVFSGHISMEPADTLVADCDAANAITLTAYGYEQNLPI